MTRRWLNERKHEYYYLKAKRMDYRSRAAFKLIQIDERFHIFRPGDSVVDLGASPGGWSQVARDLIGEQGRIIGVDLVPIRPLEGVETIVGDITAADTIRELLRRLGGKADVVISDMAPNIGGNYATDHARSVHLANFALEVCDRLLKEDGKLVMKVFMGDLFKQLKDHTLLRFDKVSVHTPEATRKESSEVYVIAEGFHAREVPPAPLPAEEPGSRFRIRGELR
ncbi:MAG: RlmE family RNA methyltransferase [Candidatus Methanomethylophilaceae archaeon]|jgi:23S rRNA (uridine2552-2'-O)-methyltransferase